MKKGQKRCYGCGIKIGPSFIYQYLIKVGIYELCSGCFLDLQKYGFLLNPIYGKQGTALKVENRRIIEVHISELADFWANYI